MVPVVYVERARGCGRVPGVVIGEIWQTEEASLVGLLVVAIHSEVLLQHRVQPLRLAVRLEMEGGGAVGLYPQQLQQPPPKVGCEHIRCRHRFSGWDEQSLFSEAIDDHEDDIVVVAWR